MVVVRSHCEAFVTLPRCSAFPPLICKDFSDGGRSGERVPATSPKIFFWNSTFPSRQGTDGSYRVGS